MTPQTNLEKARFLLDFALHGEELTWQELTADGKGFTPVFQTFQRLLETIYRGIPVRFDPDRPWPYNPETRDGVAVWTYIRFRSNKTAVMFFDSIQHARDYAYGLNGFIGDTVAADPRDPTRPPPEVRQMNLCKECQEMENDGGSIYPYYGMAPQSDWPNNFEPDEGSEGAQGMWYCPNAGCDNSNQKEPEQNGKN